MSATAISPRPTSADKSRPDSFWLIATCAVSVVLVAGTAFFLARFLPLAFTIAVLLIASGMLPRVLQSPMPTRLVPIGLARGLTVKLAGHSMLVGRLPCCPVEIPLPTISSHHCRLARLGSRWYVEDLDSRNGTFVNGKRIRRKRLHVGDKISVGEFAFRVE